MSSTSLDFDAAPATQAPPVPRRIPRFSWPSLRQGEQDRVLAREATYRRLLAVGDVGAALLGVLVVAALSDQGITPVMLLPPVFIVLLAKVHGLYERDDFVIKKGTLDETPRLFQLATLFAILSWLTAPTGLTANHGHLRLVFLWLTVLVALVAFRVLARALASLVTEPERCLFVGDRADAWRFAEKLAIDNGTHAQLVADMPVEQAKTSELGVASVRRHIDELGVHRVVIAPGSADSEDAYHLVPMLKQHGVRVSVLPRIFEVLGSSVAFDELGGTTLLGVKHSRLSVSSRALKRTLDIVGAGLGVLALVPLGAIIAVAIRATSRGPVFFRQSRVGQNGRHFRIFKFRTMVVDAEAQKASVTHLNEGADGFFKIAEDPRVTRVGRLLRRLSIDELPQLLNVLSGEMSLVGPRPLIAEEDDLIEGFHRQRLELTPGMTGPWQVLGSSRVPLRDMMAIDYLYVANWSLWTDIKILLRTVGFVLSRRGL